MSLAENFIFFPCRDLVGTPADLGLQYQDAYFATSDSVRLHGWFVPGPGDITWLWCHGNAGNISHRLENIQMIHQRLKVNILIFDYRGYGQSEGSPAEQGTYTDSQAALSYLKSLDSVKPDHIVLFGRSLGCAVAVDLATKERALGLILESPFASLASLARVVYPFLPVTPLLRGRYDNLAKIAKVTMPKLIIHSRDDEVCPYQDGQQLYEAAPEPKRFYTVEGASHNDVYLKGGEAYWQAQDDFLRSL